MRGPLIPNSSRKSTPGRARGRENVESCVMADIFSMTAPLMIRLPSGEKRVVAEYFPHPRGILYFDLFWHLSDQGKSIHLVQGSIKGEGPWKVGDCVLNVLGCHGTDPDLASEFDDWRQYLMENADAYPAAPMVRAIARRHGALVNSVS